MIFWEQPTYFNWQYSVEATYRTDYFAVTSSETFETTNLTVVYTDEDGTTTTYTSSAFVGTRTRFTSTTSSSEEFASTNFGTVTGIDSSSSQNAVVDVFNDLQNTHFGIATSTTGTVSSVFMATTQTTTEFAYITSTSVEDGWTTAQSTSTEQLFLSTTVQSTKEVMSVTVLPFTHTANATNTIYMANTGTFFEQEVLYVAGSAQGVEAETAIRTTISAKASIVPIGKFSSGESPALYEGVFYSAPAFTYSALVSEAGGSERIPNFGEPVLRSFNASEDTYTRPIYSTATSSYPESVFSSSYLHYGNTYSFTSIKERAATASRLWNGTLAYHDVYISAQVITVFSTASAVIQTGSTQTVIGNATYGSTVAANGNNVAHLPADAYGVRANFGDQASNSPRRLIYKSAAAYLGDERGAYYDIDVEPGVLVYLAQTNRAGGNFADSQIYDKTEKDYTMRGDSLTMRLTSDSNSPQYKETTSLVLKVSGEEFVTGLWAEHDCLGGSFLPGETVVESIPRGLWYLPKQNTTTFIDQPHQFLADSENTEVTAYVPLCWNEISFTDRVLAVAAFSHGSPPDSPGVAWANNFSWIVTEI
jgi:hypothetical protein